MRGGPHLEVLRHLAVVREGSLGHVVQVAPEFLRIGFVIQVFVAVVRFTRGARQPRSVGPSVGYTAYTSWFYTYGAERFVVASVVGGAFETADGE